MTDADDDIMAATYCALCKHGYAEVTMRDIAAESELSKASLHYHYESKHGLMVAFLDHLYENFTARVGGVERPVEHPDERLRAFLDDVLHPPDDEDAVREFRTALLEIKAQAPYDEAFRERLEAFDEHVRGVVRDLVAAGVADGTYRADADPDRVAQFVVTVVDGAQSRHVVAGDDPDSVQETIDDYLDTRLLPAAEASS